MVAFAPQSRRGLLPFCPTLEAGGPATEFGALTFPAGTWRGRKGVPVIMKRESSIVNRKTDPVFRFTFHVSRFTDADAGKHDEC
jgi:hypothetical protein